MLCSKKFDFFVVKLMYLIIIYIIIIILFLSYIQDNIENFIGSLKSMLTVLSLTFNETN